MAITNAQQTQILKIVIGLFNSGISAGNLSIIATLVDDEISLSDLFDQLATGSLFTDNILGGKVTVQNKVNVMMNNFGLVADSDSTSAGSQAEQFFTDTISGGVGLGAIVNAVVDFLSQDNLPTAFAATAALLDNKAVVAEIYAGRNPPDDFATMIALLADVTATSPATRDDAIAFVDIFDANKISLTSGIDNLVGTSGVDIFTGDQNTLSSDDTLVGGDGQDILQLFNAPFNSRPNISGIEKVVYISPAGFPSVSDLADVTSVELKNILNSLSSLRISQGQAVTLTNIVGNDNSNVSLRGNFASLDLMLDQVILQISDSILSGLAIQNTDLTTLNITLANNASSLEIKSNSLFRTLNIMGDQDLTARIPAGVTTLDASSASGNIVIDASNLRSDHLPLLNFKGGSGDDTFTMGEALRPDDRLMGGAGIDTLSVNLDLSRVKWPSATVNISEFEVLEITGRIGPAFAIDLSSLNATNTLSGLIIDIDNFGVDNRVSIKNINFDSANNIQITRGSTHLLHASDFTTGGTQDTAIITLDNNLSSSSGIAEKVNFIDLDFLHLVSKNGDSPKHFFNSEPINSFSLFANDLDEIKISGNESLHLFLTDRPSQIDASELDAPLDFVLESPATPSTSNYPFIEVTGTTYDDRFDFRETAINTSFLFTGGGSDLVIYNGENLSDKRFMVFSATELNTGDLKAGDYTAALLLRPPVGATVTIELTSALEGLLKSGGTFLSATNTNIDIHGTSLSDTTNIAAIQSINAFGIFGLDLQFDLNGDGFFNARDDAEISLLGSGFDDFNDTLVYDATADALIYTVF